MSKLVLRIMGEKVIGQADDNEKEKLIRIIAEDIASIESTLSIEQIIKILRETKMYFMEKLPVMNGAAGCSIGKDIYVDIGFLEYLNNDDILEEIRSDPEYKTVVHECIHRIQNNYGIIGRNKYWGLIEGVTESESLKIDGVEQGKFYDGIRYNFDGTVYLPNVAIVRQLERIYGREVIEKLAYKNDKEVERLLDRDYGDYFTDSLLKILRTEAAAKDVDYTALFNIQFRLMAKFFTDRLDGIENIEEAESFLKEFEDYMTDLMHFEDMSKYEELYNKLLEFISKKFPEFDSEKHKYKKPDLYPLGSLEERINMVNFHIKFCVEQEIISEDTKETEENFNNYNPDDYQKYMIIQDGTVFSLIIYPDKRCFLVGLYGSFDKKVKAMSGEGKYNSETDKYEIRCLCGNEIINCEFNPENNDLSFDTVLEDIEKSYLHLEEEPLDLSKEELSSEIEERYKVSQKTAPLSQKISSMFSEEQLFDYEETKTDEKSR